MQQNSINPDDPDLYEA